MKLKVGVRINQSHSRFFERERLGEESDSARTLCYLYTMPSRDFNQTFGMNVTDIHAYQNK